MTTQGPRNGVLPKVKAIPVTAWGETAGSSREALEKDAGDLIRQLSEGKWSLTESEKKNKDDHIKMFLPLLEAMDAFERVFAHIQAKKENCTPQMNIWVGNFRTVYRLLNKALSEQGIVPIENLDQGFDPKWHTVAETVYDLTQAEGAIVQEAQRGYLWQGRLLRKSQVVVVTHRQVELNPE